MNEERHNMTSVNTVKSTVKPATPLSRYSPFQCVLRGSVICPYPDICSGYSNRKCNNWKNHSSK